jgi:hypothetical protein
MKIPVVLFTIILVFLIFVMLNQKEKEEINNESENWWGWRRWGGWRPRWWGHRYFLHPNIERTNCLENCTTNNCINNCKNGNSEECENCILGCETSCGY